MLNEEIKNLLNARYGRPYDILHNWSNGIKAHIVLLHREQLHFVTCEKIHDMWTYRLDKTYHL